MKNISRRVFIKGLAVAGVAAAASTVLAGCNTNMIPGVGDGAEDDTVEDVTPGNVQTVTWTDQANDKKLTIKVTDVVNDEINGRVYLYAEVLNELGNEIKLGAAAATEGKYGLQGAATKAVVVKDANGVDIADANNTKIATEDEAPTVGVRNLVKQNNHYAIVSGDRLKGVLVLAGIAKEWKNITLKLDVDKFVGASHTGYGSIEIKVTNK